ncbi:MAG TPA: hypothetical protein VGS06_44830 [Streptosporangiaceae bacterium]|nr:hypothetical protein [Streptosporangiaceae bacterium]
MIHQCWCNFATDDELWFESHRAQHILKREHDVSGLTVGQLERARRDLVVSLSLAFPGSPVRVPILAEISAIDAELAARVGGPPGQLPGSPFALSPWRVRCGGLRRRPGIAPEMPGRPHAGH